LYKKTGAQTKNGEKETSAQSGTVNFERRRYPRYNIDLPIEYFQIDSSFGHPGRSLSISEGGLLIYFPEQMEIHQHLRLRFSFSSGSELTTIEVLAEVVWKDIHVGKDWGGYRCGVKFVDVHPEDMAKLKSFLGGLS
jgi:c-di-GMP-binding flagellar brake protein YcgR